MIVVTITRNQPKNLLTSWGQTLNRTKFICVQNADRNFKTEQNGGSGYTPSKTCKAIRHNHFTRGHGQDMGTSGNINGNEPKGMQ